MSDSVLFDMTLADVSRTWLEQAGNLATVSRVMLELLETGQGSESSSEPRATGGLTQNMAILLDLLKQVSEPVEGLSKVSQPAQHICVLSHRHF